ncbi:MAG: hypothetical protein COY82_02585, partial [Parcubacteria group bacterium CG_4_10_14_0_8_um_filter_35_7]
MFRNLKWQWLISLVVLFVSFFILPQNASAYSTEDFSQNVYIGANEVIGYNLVRVGESIDIRGKVEGDVMVVGNTVNIEGEVKGDVLGLGGIVRILGNVEGDVRVAGGIVEIKGDVGKNVNILAGTIIIHENARVGHSLSFLGGNVEIKGPVSSNIDGRATQIILNSEVGGNVNLKINPQGKLILSPRALIKGDFTYTAPDEAQAEEGAEIKGKTFYKPLVALSKEIQRRGRILWLFKKIISLFGLLVVGMVLVTLMDKKLQEATDKMTRKFGISLLLGFIYLIVIPFVLMILTGTIIGIPLALIGFLLYLISLYVSQIFAGIIIGK